MPKFTVEIDMDNDSFCDDPLAELNDILVRVIASYHLNCDKNGGEICTDKDQVIRDTNGNTVGSWSIG